VQGLQEGGEVMDGDGGFLLYVLFVFILLMVGVALAWFIAWTILAAIGLVLTLGFLLLFPSILTGFIDGWRDGRRS
jgi:hypothetical protein